ncbi:MAG: hybrid sensor histidine kinase/response regulator [Elusimicrobiota bacterium]
MDSPENGFAKKLLLTFRVEADEHIRNIASGLLELERSLSSQTFPRPEALETTFRAAHSLKGASHAVHLEAVEAVCQSLESVFAALKKGTLPRTQGLVDMLLDAVKVLEELAALIGSEAMPKTSGKIAEIIHRLDQAGSEKPPAAAERLAAAQPPLQEAPASERPAAQETVRIPLKNLESLLLQVEEMLLVKLTAGQRIADMRTIRADAARWKKEWSKLEPALKSLGENPDGNRLPAEKIVEFLYWSQDLWSSLESKLKALLESLSHYGRSFGALVDRLHEDAKKTLMPPFSSILESFPRLVLDLLRDEGKEADLVVEGAEIAVDRQILQEIKDPLLHLLRNAVDHGIEKPQLRARKGKPPRGKISISISKKNGNRVDIRVADDGTGIDLEKTRSSAVKIGLFTEEEAKKLDAEQTSSLIFHSGVSTAPIITALSGRGLGLAIVQEKVLQLNGTLSVESPPSGGTVFHMVLPHTLSAYRAILIKVGPEIFGVPTSQTDRAARVRFDEIKTVENKEILSLGGRTFPLVRLCDILGVPSQASKEQAASGYAQILIIGSGEQRVAVVIDELLEEQELLTRSLGPPLSRVRNVGGAAVLGTGQAIAVLNVADLLKSAAKASSSSRAAGPKKPLARRKTILVAEDSITTRTLLKNILEAAGYFVKTAIDGAEAYATLRTQACDLVLSDVDMPRMSGFDLTAKIRSDKKLAELPVVLVTALESGEDRERGIDVGADAYIVKGNFEQSDLLEAIERLIA